MNTVATNQNGAMAGFVGNNGGQNQHTMQNQKVNVGANTWKCECGTDNTGKFCQNCGKPQPAPNGWTCECGATNQGEYCHNCGKPKPQGAPLYKCDKCRWTPEDPMNPPKFCPECGDAFDESDKQ